MNTIRNHKLNRVAVFLLLMACLFSMTGFSAKAAGSTSIWLPVKQTFEASGEKVPEDQQVFKYSLVPLEAGNPMPEGSSENEYVLTLTGNQETEIKIDYSNTGVYSYHFRPVLDDSREGYICDDEQYTITVYVKYNAQGKLISDVSVAKRTNGMKVASLAFTNSYETGSSDVNPSGNEAQDTGEGTAEDVVATTDNAAVNQLADGDGAEGLSEAGGEDLEELGSEDVPRGLRNTDAWALWNLIFAVATVMGSIILFVTYLKKRTESENDQNSAENLSDEDEEKKKICRPARIFSLIVSIASVVFFILTEDITLPMKWVDQYTWIMVVAFLVQVVDMIYIRKKEREEKENEEA